MSNENQQTQLIYHYDDNFCYVAKSEALPDPLEQGRWLIPAFATDIAPPEMPEQHTARFSDGIWEIIPDYRGETIYSTEDGSAVMMETAGEIPSGYTLIAPPDELHTWNEKARAWELDKAKKAAAIEAARGRVWEEIKQKRYDNLRGGVFVKSVGKWFHSNDESRAQYTFLRTLPQLPEGMVWKTMENGFVPMTRALLDELSLALIADEQHDFAVAEKHRAAVMASETPESYDYGEGWTKTFDGVTQ